MPISQAVIGDSRSSAASAAALIVRVSAGRSDPFALQIAACVSSKIGGIVTPFNVNWTYEITFAKHHAFERTAEGCGAGSCRDNARHRLAMLCDEYFSAGLFYFVQNLKTMGLEFGRAELSTLKQ